MAIMAIGPSNFVIFRILFAEYGQEYAFFVSQGVNLLYCVYGGLLLYPKMCFGTEITREMRALPQYPFMIMAFLDCLGTFLSAMGAVYTPGQYQTLLNQTHIPCTMGASAFFLRSTFSRIQLSGACIIMIGALVVLSPDLTGHQGSTESHGYANFLYWASNVPMALSAVYKEYKFADGNVHVLYLTQWVSIYQFLFGFFLAPLQVWAALAPSSAVELVRGPLSLLSLRYSDIPRSGLSQRPVLWPDDRVLRWGLVLFPPGGLVCLRVCDRRAFLPPPDTLYSHPVLSFLTF